MDLKKAKEILADFIQDVDNLEQDLLQQSILEGDGITNVKFDSAAFSWNLDIMTKFGSIRSDLLSIMKQVESKILSMESPADEMITGE